MLYKKLGKTNLEVSLLCLGTMSFGEQNTEIEAHDQLDYALERGINLIDTAEMYAIPPRKETCGLTEKYIGSWIKKFKRRDKYYIATKVAGPGMDYVRKGSRLSKKQIIEAVDNSLKRLQTDYIDLYQVHWPERKSNYFGRLGYVHDKDDDGVAITETMEALNEIVDAGKVRYIGVSNETPWGVMEYLRLSEKSDQARIVSIQNPYSLLNRTYEVGLAEMSHREDVGLLAYSPLAFGILTGKYEKNTPANSRMGLFGDWFTRYSNDQCKEATTKYIQLAKELNMSATHLALAFVNTRSFITSNIIGATTLEQLEENIDSIDIKITDEINEKINAIHQSIPNPAP
ncbi:MAG: NADP(H)-dependent aldo-keto reductase [Gammaproteobacteria bacterium]|nr:NADP(H)-dependent aldo-keto reductase [Gammaproteobacteria bacterium]|tara:strand:+ start:113159 stop:114190 length:1032 start_codon:yes stop_codon:yes gene_type:complete